MDLEAHGFGRAAFSLLTSEQAVQDKLGRRYRRVEEVEDNPKAPRESFFSGASRLDAGYGLAPDFIGAVAVGDRLTKRYAANSDRGGKRSGNRCRVESPNTSSLS